MEILATNSFQISHFFLPPEKRSNHLLSHWRKKKNIPKDSLINKKKKKKIKGLSLSNLLTHGAPSYELKGILQEYGDSHSEG